MRIQIYYFVCGTVLAIAAWYSFLLPGTVHAQSGITIPIGYQFPADIQGGADKATLQQAAVFAWQEFIALNWPALSGTRDKPDTKRFFGDLSQPGVWQTARGKVEIFPGNGSATVPPHGYIMTSGLAPPAVYGYQDPPKYIYNPANTGTKNGEVVACPGQAPVTNASWINLDETSQIGLDLMYAGQSPAAENLIRFMAKANHTEYDYVLQNKFWYASSPTLAAAKANFRTAISAKPPAVPVEPYVNFANGTVELKAAWRKLGANDDASRYYQTKVRYYETSNGLPCYAEDTWALIALHIIQKTPTAPSFIYATFEQVDNVVPPSPAEPTSTTPALTYKDSATTPKVSIVGSTYCTSPGQQLNYLNTGGAGLPSGGNICVNQRDRRIPPVVSAVNTAAQAELVSYTSGKGFSNTPWQYYQLINVQAEPFDKSKINADPKNPNNTHNPSTFYQANVVVETNYTLQNFSGRISTSSGGAGAPTDYDPTTGLHPPFQNVFTFLNGQVQSFNMGGCMGCHGNAQVAKFTDFSFILAENTVREPDTTSTPAAKLRVKYSTHK